VDHEGKPFLLSKSSANIGGGAAVKEFNLVDLIDRHASSHRVAIHWNHEDGREREVTYKELQARSERVGKGLVAAGLQQGERILLLLPRIPEATIAYMGALRAGLTVIPGSEMLQAGDIRYRLRHAEAVAVIMDHSLVDRVDEAVRDIPSIRAGWVVNGDNQERWGDFSQLGEDAGVELPQTHEEDIAFLSYTSGTTGGPKGVLHQHRWARGHHGVASKEWLDIREGDRVWATAGPGWAKWIWSPFLSTLASGATAIVYQGRFDPEAYLSLMEKKHVNVLCCTPTEYRMMAKVERLERFQLPHLRSAVSAGEPLNREVIDQFKRHFGVIVRDGYGQTENSLLVGTLKGMTVKPGTMGKPIPGNRVEIIDKEGRPVAVGKVGDIAVHQDSPILFVGYYRDEERTRQAFRGPWYLTGDQGRRDEEGYFWFEGRSDDMIISSGYTIGPFEVEDALVRHPAVRECAVVASPDPLRGSIVKAFVVLKPGHQPNEALGKTIAGTCEGNHRPV
jgi:acetyl-CoA synthetase